MAFDLIVALIDDDYDDDNDPDGHQEVKESSDDDYETHLFDRVSHDGSNVNEVGADEAVAVGIVNGFSDKNDGKRLLHNEDSKDGASADDWVTLTSSQAHELNKGVKCSEAQNAKGVKCRPRA